ncbi:type II toxin-antitoxin system Phd/YefM family antitoxin [Geobacter sp. SVR]|uniref:type II toxin-antitoxin system Phd/YefM family antitoxin n=1 Tax=Geobacter sp. SVR TaxID=2495594 RepID=UPI00143EF60A|nr:type II toxin-antitoxin system Phd/YefM family antitoxin [Geobacter sp. SVR]BCS55440.1 antitoxin [Geobacter sp. SVR]GCF83442.1 antitoxin [Geobacter sp. SVR]
MKTNKKDRSSHDREWQLQEAKNRLSQVVDQALHDGPQTITLRGKPAAVLLSFDEYRNLTRPHTGLSQFFRQSPLHDVELDVSRSADLSREVEL